MPFHLKRKAAGVQYLYLTRPSKHSIPSVSVNLLNYRNIIHG